MDQTLGMDQTCWRQFRYHGSTCDPKPPSGSGSQVPKVIHLSVFYCTRERERSITSQVSSPPLEQVPQLRKKNERKTGLKKMSMFKSTHTHLFPILFPLFFADSNREIDCFATVKKEGGCNSFLFYFFLLGGQEHGPFL